MTSAKDVITVTNVSKMFRIPHEKKTTLFENITGMFDGTKGYEEFIALKNIDFTVKKGEAIGIIGENGSGKSTLLKIISNILRPTSGSVKVDGKITSFLELGVGFQPDLTAKENIYVYGAVMGLSDREIDDKLDEILEFSGLERFKDTKLKNLSSGMQVRLAFATAIQTDPEILMMDEVLAVGDMEFQQKCLDVFQRYIKEKRTILFVSHDLGSVRRFCSKALLLRHGEQVAFDETNEIIDKYVYGLGEKKIEEKKIIDYKQKENNPVIVTDKSKLGNKQVIINDVKFYDKFGNENINFISGDPLTMRILYKAQEVKKDPIFGLGIYNEDGKLCYETNTELEKFEIKKLESSSFIDFKIKYLPFWAGKFFVTVRCRDKKFNFFDWKEKEYSFVVMRDPKYSNLSDISLYNMPSEWSLTDTNYNKTKES